MLRDMLKVSKNFIFDCDVNITIFDGDSTSTTSKELDIDIVVAQQKLYSFEGDGSSIMVVVCLFQDFIGKFLKLFSNDRQAGFLDTAVNR